MKHKLILTVLLALMVAITGCSRMQIDDFKGVAPEINPFEFFLGDTEGHGYFYDRWGDIRTSFVLKLKGHVNAEGSLILDEVLTYRNGDVTERRFEIKRQDDETLRVNCNDFPEPGKILVAGNALNWHYSLIQDIGGRVLTLRFDDWMFKMNDHLMLNRAKAYWYGIEVGEVFMVVEKKGVENGR